MGTEQTTKTAPCGCTFRGRIYSTADCTKVDRDTQTGHQLMRHAMNAKKKAVPCLRRPVHRL